MYGYIYMTTNLINGLAYIGKHKSSEFDSNYKGSGIYLNRAISKYGYENFYTEMLCPCFSESELNDEERFLISYFGAQSDTSFYNIAPGGYGGFAPGENHPHYHRSPSESTRRKLSESLKGRKFTDDHRRNLSKSVAIARTGISLSEAHKESIRKAVLGESNPFYGKHHSDSTRKSISNSLSGRQLSESTREKISKSMSGSNNPRYGVVVSESTRKKMSESSKNRIREFHLICKKCHKEFVSKGPNRHYCDDCK